MENSTTTPNKDVDIITRATEKIKTEFKNFSGGNKEEAVSSYVSTIIQDFCRQDERFAEVVYKFKRTLSDCCADIMHGVGSHISDIDVYRNAVKFYFPNSEIEMNMTINITGEAPSEDEISKEAEKPKPKPKKKAASKSKTKTTLTPPETDSKPPKKKAVKKKKNDTEVIQLSMF